MNSQRIRRGVAILALLGGLGAALYTMRDDSVEAQAVLLLGHVRYALPGSPPLALGRDRLVGLRIRPAHAQVGWVVRVDYGVGEAPPATHALKLRVPAGVESLEVHCLYDGGGATPFEGRSLVHVAHQTELQTIDIEPCGAATSMRAVGDADAH